MFKKIIIIYFMGFLVIILSLTGCNKSVTNTTSYIKVNDKGGNKDGQYWISVNDPNQSEYQSKKFKIYLDNENTWNLIQTGKEYLANYDSIDGKIKLKNISIPGQKQKDSKLVH